MASQGSSSKMQKTGFLSLAMQGSIYSLTLNEIENHLGEPLNNMNFDDFLKSVLPRSNVTLAMDMGGTSRNHAFGSSLQNQRNISMPHTFINKTVEGVWKDVLLQGENWSNEEQLMMPEWQTSFGEMTLEEFLVKAGVLEVSTRRNEIEVPIENPIGNVGHMEGMQDYVQGAHWLPQYHQMTEVQQQVHLNLIGNYPIGTDNQMGLLSPMVGATSESQSPRRKRAAQEEMADKIIERRQRRMIKNRESAARSRARKQAYTNELEIKVAQLEVENQKLKKQKEFNKLVFENQPAQQYLLKRTNSAPF